MADNIFSGIGDAISGVVTALQPGRVQQMQQRKSQQSFVNEMDLFKANPTQEGWSNLQQHPVFKDFTNREQSKVATIRASQDVGKWATTVAKMGTARDSMASRSPGGKMTPEMEGVFNEIDAKLFEDRPTTQASGSVELAPVADTASAFIDSTDAFKVPPTGGGEFEMIANAMERGKNPPDFRKESEAFIKDFQRNSDFFQVSTPDSPKEDLPKTFEDVGMDSPQDIETMQDIQKAVPDVDLMDEYKQNPEGMKRILEGFRKGTITRKLLQELFASLQQSAKQALGIT